MLDQTKKSTVIESRTYQSPFYSMIQYVTPKQSIQYFPNLFEKKITLSTLFVWVGAREFYGMGIIICYTL